MKILDLNCQHGIQPALKSFLPNILETAQYDFLILQEVNELTYSFLENTAYKLLRPFNDDTAKWSELCIVYRSKFTLTKNGFKSFASLHTDPVVGRKHPSVGVLWADFKVDNEDIRIATAHLHSGIYPGIRLNEVQLIKNILHNESLVPTLIAGDFNAGYPHEAASIAKSFAPEFAWANKNLEATLNSRYSEDLPHITNQIAVFLNRFNLGVKLRADHIFINKELATEKKYTTKVLPDRVSDHSPVEFYFQ